MSNKEKTINKQSANNKGLVNFFKGLKAEFNRITWAPKKDVKKATASVVSFCILYIILIGIFDAIFINAFKLIFK